MTQPVRNFASTSKLCSHVALSMSQLNDIAISSEDGIHVLDMSERCLQQKDQFPLKVARIKPPAKPYKLGPATKLMESCQPETFTSELSVMLRYDRGYQPHTGAPSRGFKLTAWSLPGLDTIGRCVLLTLSLDFRLTLYTRGATLASWTEVCCLSDMLQNHMKEEKYYTTETRGRTANYCYQVDCLTTTVICWQPISNEGPEKNTSQRLVSGTRSGHLVFWTCHTPLSVTNVVVDRVVKLPDKCVSSSLAWCGPNADSYLVVGCVDGTIHKLSLNDYSTTDIWTETDGISVSSIIWLKERDALVCAKGVYLLTFPSVSNAVVRSVGIQCISTKHHITGLEACGTDQILAVTHSQVLKTTIQWKQDEAPTLEAEPLTLHMDEHYKIGRHGMVLSSDQLLLGLLIRPTEVFCHLKTKDPMKVYLFNMSTEGQIAEILASHKLESIQTLSLTLQCEKYHKCRDPDWIESLDHDVDLAQISLLKLKILRCHLHMKRSLCVRPSADHKEKISVLLEKVEEQISMRHMVKSLQKLKESTHKLTESEIQSAGNQCEILQCLCGNQPNIQQLVSTIMEKLGQTITTPDTCLICNQLVVKQDIRLSQCSNGHTFARCGQTFLPCTDLPYRKCVGCGEIARKCIKDVEAAWLTSLQTNHCVLCDSYLATGS